MYSDYVVGARLPLMGAIAQLLLAALVEVRDRRECVARVSILVHHGATAAGGAMLRAPGDLDGSHRATYMWAAVWRYFLERHSHSKPSLDGPKLRRGIP